MKPASCQQRLGLVTVIVQDYDEAVEFFTQLLGFELIEDTHLPDENKRWVVVSPQGARESRVLLARASAPEQSDRIGDQTGGRVSFFLYTADFWRDYETYRKRGVAFVRGPRVEKYGTVAVFRDVSGNLWDLVEPSTPAA
ncbi:MAG: VOC family protein [Planctomycetota bacterium]